MIDTPPKLYGARADRLRVQPPHVPMEPRYSYVSDCRHEPLHCSGSSCAGHYQREDALYYQLRPYRACSPVHWHCAECEALRCCAGWWRPRMDHAPVLLAECGEVLPGSGRGGRRTTCERGTGHPGWHFRGDVSWSSRRGEKHGEFNPWTGRPTYRWTPPD